MNKKRNRFVNKEQVQHKTNSQKSIYRVTYVFASLFVLMVGYYMYFLIFNSNDIVNNTYNQRHGVLAIRVTRGSIFDSEGNVLAETLTNEDGKEKEYIHMMIYLFM